MAIASSSYRKARVALEPHGVLRWLDYIPTVPLLIATVVLALSPPLSEPHLWTRLKMLASGRLVDPLDVLDLALHALLPIILLLKFLRERQSGSNSS